MLNLNPQTTALVLIDLQEGILPFGKAPHAASDVVPRAAKLADHFRAHNAPVVLVRVGWSADFADAPKQPVDAAHAGGALPDNWWVYPDALGVQESDLHVIKRQWGHSTVPIWNCNCAVVALTPLCWVASPPTLALSPPHVTPGNWVSIW